MRFPANSIAVGLSLALTVSGCADQATAPSAPAVPGMPLASSLTQRLALNAESADFTVTPSGGYFQLGPHAVYFPSFSICDPAVSSYGIGTWDEPCRPLRKPIQIHAELRYENGRYRVEFTPALRFVPSPVSSRWVWLYMWRQDFSAAASRAPILWSPYAGAEPIDESLSDPTQQTHYIESLNLAYRRIKHFSGYQIHDGLIAESEEDGEGGGDGTVTTIETW